MGRDFHGDGDGDARGGHGFEIGHEIQVAFAGELVAHLAMGAVPVFDVGRDCVGRAQVNARLQVEMIDVKMAYVEIDFDVVAIRVSHEPIDFVGGVEGVARVGAQPRE